MVRQVDAYKGERSDEWGTPPEIYDPLHEEFDFDFDPCPLGGPKDALLKDWGRRVFCNPPYSADNVDNFFNKARTEIRRGNTDVAVFLVFSKTDTRWFHKWCWDLERHEPRPGVELRFFKGRIKFEGSKNGSAPAPSMLVIMR